MPEKTLLAQVRDTMLITVFVFIDLFKWGDAKKIARELKASAEKSDRRKAPPYRSAMSMLTFYINRAGKNISAGERKTLEAAKTKLRSLFGR